MSEAQFLKVKKNRATKMAKDFHSADLFQRESRTCLPPAHHTTHHPTPPHTTPPHPTTRTSHHPIGTSIPDQLEHCAPTPPQTRPSYPTPVHHTTPHPRLDHHTRPLEQEHTLSIHPLTNTIETSSNTLHQHTLAHTSPKHLLTPYTTTPTTAPGAGTILERYKALRQEIVEKQQKETEEGEMRGRKPFRVGGPVTGSTNLADQNNNFYGDIGLVSAYPVCLSSDRIHAHYLAANRCSRIVLPCLVLLYQHFLVLSS